MKALDKLIQTFLWKVGTVAADEKGRFPYGNCIISYSITEDTYLDNVAQALAEVDIPREETDIWNSHGFRNEADFIQYKYR